MGDSGRSRLSGVFHLLALVLKRGIPVGVAYGVRAVIGVAATAVLGSFFLADPLTSKIAGGVVLIAADVYLLESGAVA